MRPHELTSRNGSIVRAITDGLKPYLGDAKVLIVVNPVDVMTKIAVKARPCRPAAAMIQDRRFRGENGSKGPGGEQRCTVTL